MKKLLIGSTALFVLLLFIGGMYYPNTLEMYLADTSLAFTMLRAVIFLMLLTLLVTNPPRSRTVRTVIGVWAVLLAAIASRIVYGYDIELLDAVVFLQVAIILGIEALELTPGLSSETRRIPVRHAAPSPRKITVTTT